MGLESPVTQISHLVETNPLGSDDRQYGDDHIRAIKVAVKSLLTNPGQLSVVTNALFTAKGSLAGASAASTPAERTVGTNGQLLKADSTHTSGLGWQSQGTGNGLDADTLDGSHASAFATSAALALIHGLKSIQSFTSSGTWTRPSGVKTVIIFAKGGGGGGGAYGVGTSGAGGGEGATAIKVLDVSAIASAAITVGAGGSGGASPSAGSNSSFAANCVGSGGAAGSNYQPQPAQTGGTGDFVIPGAAGQAGMYNPASPNIEIGGTGGGAGGGAASSPGGTPTAGVKGGGGAGGSYMSTGPAANHGSAGGAGFVVVIEFGS